MPYSVCGWQCITIIHETQTDKQSANHPSWATVTECSLVVIQLRRSSILICFRDACQIIIVQLIQTNQLVDVGCPSGSWTAFCVNNQNQSTTFCKPLLKWYQNITSLNHCWWSSASWVVRRLWSRITQNCTMGHLWLTNDGCFTWMAKRPA